MIITFWCGCTRADLAAGEPGSWSCGAGACAAAVAVLQKGCWRLVLLMLLLLLLALVASLQSRRLIGGCGYGAEVRAGQVHELLVRTRSC